MPLGALLREAPEHAAVTLVGLRHDLLELAGAPVIAASGFLGALPAVLLVLVFQKYMVQGLTAGSVKG